MSAGKIFGFLKKGAKKAGKGKKKGDKKQVSWPSGTRLGVVGHTNAGKTCYFTVLNECCKTDRRIQISVSDHTTAAEFLSNYRSIWGLATAVSSGTAVDLRGDQKFPDPTTVEKVIQFNAILDRGRKVNVVSYDYPGCAIDINDRSEMKDRVEEFLAGSDGLLFLYDPKLLQAELQNQAHVSSFINVIEQVAPLGSKLPIPVALVVTKADILPGFSGEDQVILVPTADESILAEDFEIFLQRVLESNRLQDNPKWAATVRELLLKMRDFLRVVVGRTLNFQIFFSSHTGNPPEKIGTDIGKSIYRPSRKIVPVGVKEPMYWLLNAIVANRRISRFRWVARWAVTLSVTWVVIFSIPFAWHFWYSLPETQRIESDTLKPYGNNLSAITDKGVLSRVKTAYYEYHTSWMVRNVFRSFGPPAERIYRNYLAYDVAEAGKGLEGAIARFTDILKDPTRWPKVDPVDTSKFLENPRWQGFRADLDLYHQGDTSTELYARADRVVAYAELFVRAIKMPPPQNTLVWKELKELVKAHQASAATISAAEDKLGAAIAEYEVKAVQQVVAEQTATEVADRGFVKEINGNTDPAYRLVEAVDILREKLSLLGPSDTKHRQMIQKYLDEVSGWQRSQQYTFTIESAPKGSHLHIAVADADKKPAYEVGDQLLEGQDRKITWKPGQYIHIAVDVDPYCGWGNEPSDKVTLDGDFALFDLENGVTFPQLKQPAKFRFNPPLTKRLPELK